MTAADIAVASAQPVDRADARSAHHPDLDEPGLLRGQAAVGTPRLTTAPSLIQASAKVSSGGISWQFTYSGTASKAAPGTGEDMASEPCARGPGNRSTCAHCWALPKGGAGRGSPPEMKRSSSAAMSATGVAGSASSTTSAVRRVAGDATVSASRMIVPSVRYAGNDAAGGPPITCRGGAGRPQSAPLLQGGGELGVGLLEGPRGSVQVLAHAGQALRSSSWRPS